MSSETAAKAAPHPRSLIPEPERLIRVHGEDWSPYTCDGKWVLYKKPQRHGKPGRFMRQDQYGNWVTDREVWINRERWEYLDDPAATNPAASVRPKGLSDDESKTARR